MSDINPHFKIKYARGFGDVITYILHGSPLKWITKNLLGIKEPCSQCSKRAAALNILFPIPVWRIFFKSQSELIQDLSEELTSLNYKVNISSDGNSLASVKTNQTVFSSKKNKEYILVSSGENLIGDFLIKTEIYKK